MKNRYKSIRNLSVRIALLFAILFSYTACNDILEEDPVSLATADSYYSTALGIRDGLNACYPFLRQFYGQERYFFLTVAGTDINTNGFGGWKNRPQYNNYDQNLQSTDPYFRQIWDPFYEGINQCNTIIGRTPDVADMDEDAKRKAIGEARFLRAHYYFILVQMWGDVHFTLEETVGVETEAFRTPEQTIYAEGIVPDLEYAIANLPDPGDTQHGRADKGAAEALMARVQLTLGNWSEAERLANNVMDNYSYQLQDLDQLWELENHRNSEIIWSVQYSDDPLLWGPGNRSHLFFVWDYTRNPAMDRDVENGRPFQRIMPTNYYLNLWDLESDARFDASFKTVWFANKSATINGQQVNPGDTAIKISMYPVDDAVQESAPYWYIDYNGEDVTTQTDPLQIGGDSRRLWPSFYKKYYDNTRLAVNQVQGNRDFIVIRLAEMYLIAAEAAMNQSRPADAATHINNLRQRAIKPGREAEMLVVAGDIDLNFILEERARELGGEGHRWFDLKRTGTLLERVRMYNPDAAPNIQEIHLVRPIPQTQIDRVSNPGDFPQSPGY